MDVRLVQLLASFASARDRYALARLEYAMRHQSETAPPAIARPSDVSERAMRDEWPALEAQLEAAMRYDAARRRDAPLREAAQTVHRCLLELDQYARAIAWVLTVTGTDG